MWLVSANQSQATFETYVYRLGGQYWWPVGPPGAFFAYTAIGPVSLVGVGDDAGTAALTLSASPNPSRENVGVTLRLPSRTEGELSVFDLSGRLVRRLASGTLVAGEHLYRWDLADAEGRTVKAGVYFARLTSHLASRTVRLAVLR